jgi:toxin ParE1/3/4
MDDIGAYTRDRWGPAQAVRYLTDLDACFSRVARDADLGRPYPPRPRYRRIRQGKHVVFFLREPTGDVLIVRILHQRMLPERHLSESVEDE